MIKGLTPRLAEIGKIKIGGKGEQRISRNNKKFRLPVKYDHFVITLNEKDQHGNFIIDKKIMNILEEKPKEIECILLYDNIEKNFLTSYSNYRGHKCFCRGDGEKAIRVFKDDKTQKEYKKEIICPAGECEYLINAQCKPSGLLSVILPSANKQGGVYKFRTHSWNSVQNIQSSLYYIASQTGSKLAGILLKLHIVKKSTEDHGNVITVNIVFDGNKDQLRQAVITETKHREEFNIDILKLENMAEKIGITKDNDDPSDVEDEFYNSEIVTTNKSKAMAIDSDTFITSSKPTKKDDPQKKENKKDVKNVGELL